MEYKKINEIVKKRVLDSGKFPIAKVVIVNNENLRDKLTPPYCCNNKNPDLLVISWYFENYTSVSIYVNGTRFSYPMKIERTWYCRNYESFRELLDFLIELEQFKIFIDSADPNHLVCGISERMRRLREVLL